MTRAEFLLQPHTLSQLLSHPGEVFISTILGKQCSINIIIPSHLKHLEAFYHPGILSNIDIAQQESGIPYEHLHFGLKIHFNQPMELQLHDSEMDFAPIIKQLIKQFGVVIIKNAYLHSEVRNLGHRNKFPHLKFHYDRTELQSTVYSLYSRNPFDEEQKKPRIASTLFAPNLVAYLQSLKEKKVNRISDNGMRSNYDLFQDEDMSEVISNIIVEHRWDEPEGIGELSMIDNRTVLHASYHRDGFHPGYRIGVRYCS
ncbi:MAG: hypothetical protein V3T17_18720 [Pseudomonadales bacterium]